ncbi:MAG: cyclase family protein [Proteobacteria bacterium]|nr:cyclase family protein [Pseudomonadota bacterium]
MRIIDLSMPISDRHPRWKTEVSVTGDIAAGDTAQVTWLRVSCHAFSHVDARRHMFLDGATIEATSLSDLVGRAAVIDLMDISPNEAIGPERLAPRAANLAKGGIALFKTGWDRQRSPYTREFWLDAPYLTREAAEWLLATGIRTIAYDFPQDYCIRLSLSGQKSPLSDQVTHDVLLRAGVHMVEYVVNTSEISATEVFFSAAPLKIESADGAPARVYCIEGM